MTLLNSPRPARTGKALFVFLTVAAGCGGEGLARRFSIPSEKQVSLAAFETNDRPHRFPEDTAFNITDKTSTQSPGMDGSAESAADAQPNGTAYCRLQVANGGSAQAEFHLGQCFNNPSDQSQHALVTFLCEYDILAERTDAANRPTSADYTLELYVSNAEGLVLKRLPVESSAGANAPSTGSGRMVKELAVQLEPQRAYNMVLAGRVRAETAVGGSATMRIDVRRFEVTVRTESATD